MGNTNNINLLTKISLKIVIFLMGFWSFSFFASAYNDACGEQQQSVFKTNLAKEVKLEKTFSLNGLNSDNINTILTGYNGLDYVGKSGNNLFFIHDNRLKKAVYQNGIIEDGNLFDFNNSINSKNDILTIQDGFIYYKNKQDNDSIYKLNIYCSDSTLKGAKISNPIPISDLTNYTYVFSDRSSIYYKDVFGRLYKIKNWYYGNDVENNNLVDTSITIDTFLFYDANEYYFYYTYNGKTYRVFTQYFEGINNPEIIYNFSLDSFLFWQNNNIFFYNENTGNIEFLKKDGTSILSYFFHVGNLNVIGYYNEYIYFLENGYIKTFNSTNFEKINIIKYTDISYIFNDYLSIIFLEKINSKIYRLDSLTEYNLGNTQIDIPVPSNLKQYVLQPTLDEKQEIDVGIKLGRFQSGSGIIFEAEIDNPELKEYRLNIELYRKGINGIEKYIYVDNYSRVNGKIGLKLSVGVGDYYWKLRLEDIEGNTSDWIDFKNNGADTDFSIFEGFEPYPYGFSFVNASPDISKLDGKITGYKIFNSRKKEGGTKWEIMDMVFPIESFNGDEREYFAAFESLGLNNDKPIIFSDGICFGLGISALTQYHKPEILRRNFPVFSSNIGTGYIFDKINIKNDTNNNYQLIGVDDNLKSILALQLYQKETSFDNKMNLSLENDTPIDILNKVKTNPGKYILNFKGKTGCTLGFGCNEVGHTVVPYKVEGNKIYIWDNITPYPFFEDNDGKKRFGYNQYIEIDTINNKYSVIGYDWDKFEKIGIVSIDEAFVDNTSLIGFNDIDTLYTLNGNSDILLTDINGKKTGYKNGEIYEEIPGTRIVVNYAGETTDNSWKQIYLPQKLENLTIEINGKIDENYDLMIAGGDYYTKLEGITTSSGQTDTFNISSENIKIDLDDTKTNSGTYNILVDYFQNNSTGTVMLGNLETISGKQELDINWTEVLNNSDTAVIYSKDLDNDGIQESTENLKPILDYSIEPEILPGNISGKIGLYLPQEICKKLGNKNCSQIVKQLEKEILNKTTKLVFERQEEGEEEIQLNNKNKDKDKKQNKKGKDKNKEEKQYIELDNKGNYKIVDLEPGMYKLSLELKKGWTTKTPQTGYYMLEITNGENYVDKDFQVINKLLEQLIKNFKIK